MVVVVVVVVVFYNDFGISSFLETCMLWEKLW